MEDKTGRISAQPKYPSMLIYYLLKMYRAKASYQSDSTINQFADSRLNVELTLPCVELEKVDMNECPCAPATGCYFFKSVNPLPKMTTGVPNAVTLIHQNNQQVGNGTFTYVDWYNFESRLQGVNPAQARQPYYTMKNFRTDRYLYVYRNLDDIKELKAVSVVGYFANPLEVASFPSCGDDGHVCNPLDEEFFIEQELQSIVFEDTYRALAGFIGFPTGKDLLNNEQNETV